MGTATAASRIQTSGMESAAAAARPWRRQSGDYHEQPLRQKRTPAAGTIRKAKPFCRQ